MSVYVDRDIRFLCDESTMLEPLITPFSHDQLQPASYDVLLGHHFLAIDEDRMSPVDMGDPSTFDDLYVHHEVAPGGYYKLPSKGFVLACTQEHFCIPTDVVGILHGKSTRARLGLVIESAGFVDPGFRGQLTMEVYNQLPWPIFLRPGLSIAQVSFQMCTGRPERVYGDERINSHYQDSVGAVEPRY